MAKLVQLLMLLAYNLVLVSVKRLGIPVSADGSVTPCVFSEGPRGPMAESGLSIASGDVSVDSSVHIVSKWWDGNAAINTCYEAGR